MRRMTRFFLFQRHIQYSSRYRNMMSLCWMTTTLFLCLSYCILWKSQLLLTTIQTMRVLSIQSHVVHGYVGNKAAVFPLQLLGFDVDVINSVQFSNHTGYDQKWEGDVLNGGQLDSLLDGLERNDLLKNTQHLLTGYIGSESFLRSVIRVLNTLKK